jgi:hypothetical protein
MEKSNLNSSREFLQKLLAIEEKTKPYFKELQFFKKL